MSESTQPARNHRAERWLAAAPRTVVALPGRPASEETSEFLALVDQQLADVLDGLAEVWAADDLQKVDQAQTVDVLADRDLPELLRSLASTGKRIRPTMCYWG